MRNELPWEVKEISSLPSQNLRKEIALNPTLKSEILDILNISKTNIIKIISDKPIYELVFSPEVQKDIKNGVLELTKSNEIPGAKRAIARNQSGSYVAHGNLNRYKDVKGLAVNVLTTAVSQEHLQEIREQLTEIKESLKVLERLEMDKHYGAAEGAFDYFQRVITFYQEKGKIEGSMKHQLEQIFLESLQSVHTLIKETDNISKDVEELKKSVFWKTGKPVGKLKEISSRFEKIQGFQNQYFRNLMVFIKLGELSGESESMIDSNLKQVNDLIQRNQDKANCVIKNGKYFSDLFNARIRSENHLIEKKKEIREQMDYLNSITPKKEMVTRTFPEVPKKMLVEIKDGEVVSLQKLSGESEVINM